MLFITIHFNFCDLKILVYGMYECAFPYSHLPVNNHCFSSLLLMKIKLQCQRTLYVSMVLHVTKTCCTSHYIIPLLRQLGVNNICKAWGYYNYLTATNHTHSVHGCQCCMDYSPEFGAVRKAYDCHDTHVHTVIAPHSILTAKWCGNNQERCLIK